MRFTYDDGQTFAFDVATTQSFDQVINGAAGPGAPATTTITGQTGVVTLSGETFIIETTTDSATAIVEGDPALSAQMQTAVDELVGLVERRVIDATGFISDFELDSPSGLDPSILEAAAVTGQNGVALAFPQEPVGVGAVWEVGAEVDISGLDVFQVSTYEVLSISGTVVELAVTTSQFVEPGSVMNVPGAEATVEAWSADGSGTLTVDLTSPANLGSIQVTADQTLAISAAGEEVEIVQEILTETITTPR